MIRWITRYGTRAFTKKYGRKQTIGRVQTPTLAMLAERQTKIKNFVKEPYYKVELSGAGVVAVSEQMGREQDADTMQAACDGQCAVVGSIERKRVEKKPPKLYDLTTLQREANRYYGLTASQTLQALQELYEEKLVTYPRTDSQFVTEDMRKTVESLVLALDGQTVDVSCVINNSKVTDHHAILPTTQSVKCSKEKLSETKQKILSLIIWKLVQAVQPPFIYEDVVPNHLTEQWGADFLRLYPNANVLVATKKDFEPSNRKQFCSRIATGDYDAIVIGHSQFERVPLSPERRKAIIERQIDDITLALADARSEESRSFTVKQMEKTKKTLEAKLQKLNDQTRKDDVVTFEELGVDRLFVDESHFYKNMFLYTKMRNIAGIAQTDAQKSSDMFAKCQYLDELTGGKGVTFATGTPVSNSMVELYTIMRYLQYDTLQKMGLSHFDDWAASFGETVTAIELSPEGTGYRAKTRFARFFNLPELISLFKESADVQTADMLNLPVPEAEYINEVLKPSETQEEMVSSFADRAEAVRNGSVNPKSDNMLKITNDGRKLALDQRLINDMLPDEPESKVNRCVDNAFKVWEESAPDRGTQLIFCDLSTPKADGAFNVYDDVRKKLVARGVPREEVAFIHEYNTETKKAELFAKVRAGQVRILMGSTPKLGAGTNIQDRLIALHHLDCPWKPSDLEQQEGRILRQGNRNKQVKIYRYVTENTFDSYMWQILENKQKFISQIMTSKSPVRACDDVDDTALSYAEIKALATGNPYIKEKMDLDIQVSKLKLLKANHTSQIYSLESDIARRYPREIAVAQGQIEALKADMDAAKPLLAQDKDHFSMEISGKLYTERKEAGAAIIEACKALKAAGTEGRIGSYGAFELHSRFDNFDKVFRLSIKGAWNYSMEVGKDPLGNILRVTNALAGIERALPQVERRLENLEQQLAQAKEEAKRPFAQEAELAEKSARLAELNSLLNMDEKGSEDALGVDEDAAETGVADRPRQPVNYAGCVAERTAEPQKSQKRKSYGMEL